ncbi:MAG: hypothetical protein ABI624_08360 [Casimicrobiaceae bacterium]
METIRLGIIMNGVCTKVTGRTALARRPAGAACASYPPRRLP